VLEAVMLFERSCELGLWRPTANKIAEIFGTRLHRGKLPTVIDQIVIGQPFLNCTDGGNLFSR
jgi:hypothetical protein